MLDLEFNETYLKPNMLKYHNKITSAVLVSHGKYMRFKVFIRQIHGKLKSFKNKGAFHGTYISRRKCSVLLTNSLFINEESSFS